MGATGKKIASLEEQISIVTQSFGQISLKQEFFDTFYDIFMKSSPEVKPLFAKTDFGKQKKLLKYGISYMILFAKDSSAGKSALKSIAEIHDRNHFNIMPEYYPLWIDSLCNAIRKHQTDFDESVEKAWRDVMDQGIKYFIALY
jgi:hemoglobin-like flavoprotein